MSDLDTLAATVREFMGDRGTMVLSTTMERAQAEHARRQDAHAALDALVEHARTLERTARREQETADAYQFDLARAEQRIATLERERDAARLDRNEARDVCFVLRARADRYEETLLWAMGEQNLGALIADKAAYEWWVSQIRARAALAGEDA